MKVFETKPKKWGNSLGITIPSEIVKKEHINPKKKIKVMLIEPDKEKMNKIFGTLKPKKSTQKIMKEIDEGYD